MTEKSLHSGIEFKKLKTAYENFQKIPFPSPPIDDELYDIYSELVEFDAYAAGLISIFIKGKKINQFNLYVDKKINKKLINFKTTNKQTKKEILTYINYINKLNELIDAISIIMK